MSFPTNPVNNQQATVNGINYIYSTAATAWTVLTNAGTNISALDGSFTGNVTISNGLVVQGNISTNGTITAAGINLVASSTPITMPQLSQAQINALSPQNGDLVYNTTLNLPQVYQAGQWRNFTISYYS